MLICIMCLCTYYKSPSHYKHLPQDSLSHPEPPLNRNVQCVKVHALISTLEIYIFKTEEWVPPLTLNPREQILGYGFSGLYDTHTDTSSLGIC